MVTPQSPIGRFRATGGLRRGRVVRCGAYARSHRRSPGTPAVPSETVTDPLAPLLDLPGVRDAADRARDALAEVHRHRTNRRGWANTAAEASVRAARASAAIDGGSMELPRPVKPATRSSPVRCVSRRRSTVTRWATWCRRGAARLCKPSPGCICSRRRTSSRTRLSSGVHVPGVGSENVWTPWRNL